jgi:phosphate transport system substrate-binding protein
MMSKLNVFFAVFGTFIILQSCEQKPAAVQVKETESTGSATFVVDESCQPIVDEEKYVFSQQNSEAKITLLYRPENAALRMLLNDSVRFAILTRELRDDEIKILKGRNLSAQQYRFAIDAITLIVNKTSNDTLTSVGEIKKMLNGGTKTNVNIVFDNANSSLVRYLKEFSGNKDFKLKNVFALKNNKEVIKYVSEHPGAIGITGFSWLNDPDDDYKAAVQNVKIVSVKDEASKTAPNEYFAPSQNTLALKQYPLTRGLYVINCTGKRGLGTGFAYFMLNERGQRIILRSGILPEIIPEREIKIKNSF